MDVERLDGGLNVHVGTTPKYGGFGDPDCNPNGELQCCAGNRLSIMNTFQHKYTSSTFSIGMSKLVNYCLSTGGNVREGDVQCAGRRLRGAGRDSERP